MGFWNRAKAQLYTDPYDPEDVDANREPNKSLERRNRELKFAMLAAIEIHDLHEEYLNKFMDGVKDRNLADRKRAWLKAKKKELAKQGIVLKPDAIIQAVQEQEKLANGFRIESLNQEPEIKSSKETGEVPKEDEDELKFHEFIDYGEISTYYQESVERHKTSFEQATIVPLEEVFNSKHWKAGAVQARKKFLEFLSRPRLQEKPVKTLGRAVQILDLYQELNTRHKKEVVDQADREEKEITALKSKLGRLQEELRILELHKQARSSLKR